MSLIDSMPTVKGRYSENVMLANTVWFRVGGMADVVYKPENVADLQHFMQNCPSDIPVYPIGVGSNLLIRDGGIEGVVVRLGKGFNHITMDGNELEIGAATLDSNVAEYCSQLGLSGMEFLCGIPGTIGGALRMNAGCYGGEIKDRLISLQAVDRHGTLHTRSVDECGFSYRNNSLPNDWIFVSARFQLQPSSTDNVRRTIQSMLEQRNSAQPVKSRTGGSTFTNQAPHKAWELIDKAGCRGLQIGDAQVSPKHCNFLINNGKATALDLEQLGEEVRLRVLNLFNIELEWEIQRIGRNGIGCDSNA